MLICAIVPVSVTAPVPLPVMAAPPPTPPPLTMPPPADVSVVVMSLPPLASTSEIDRPVMAWVDPDMHREGRRHAVVDRRVVDRGRR